MSLRLRVSIGVDAMAEQPMLHEARSTTIPYAMTFDMGEHDPVSQLLEELGHLGPEVERVMQEVLLEFLTKLGQFRAQMEERNG